MKKFLLYIITLFLLANTAFSETSKTPIKLLKIYDGDTVQAMIDDNIFNIRLYGIDCFESYDNNRAYKQAVQNNISLDEVLKRGISSTKFLNNLYKKSNKDVYLDFKGIDNYNRVLGILYFGNQNINDIMVKNGGCLIYKYDHK